MPVVTVSPKYQVVIVETGLALADSFILATARAHDAELWTQDSDFEGLEGVRYRARN